MEMPYKLRHIAYRIMNLPKQLVYMFGPYEMRVWLANRNIRCGYRGQITKLADLGGVGAGWKQLVETLTLDLFAMGWNGYILDIKEKFGGLRFYISEGSDAIYKRIGEAEEEARKTCEVCGIPGVLRSGGWLKTLCDYHSDGRKPYGKEDLY